MNPRYFLAPLAALALLAAPRLALAQTTPGGAVGIGTTAPDASAALDIVSSSKGLLLPRVAAASAIASPAPGLLLYQTGAPAGFYYNAGTAAAPSWQRLATAGSTTGDNLGNHTATQALNLQGNPLVGSGASVAGVGVGIRVDGGLNLGQNGTGHNLLLGYQAGQALTPSLTATDSLGAFNLFSGYQSGAATTTGSGNLFVGYQAGQANTTASGNQFIGFRAGRATTTGEGNQFSGFNSGLSNTTGYANLFSGPNSGYSNTTGYANQYLGVNAGGNSTTGFQNLFVGYGSGFNNVDGTNNTALGANAGPDRTSPTLDNATALGAGAVVSQSNSLVLGHNASVGIGTGAPSEKLQVVGTVYSSAGGFKFPDGTLQTTAGLTGGSAVLNQTSQQVNANFNIDGSGYVGGRVGIGTSSPTQRLDVDGGILARSNSPISNQGAYLQWNRSGGDGETWLLNQKGGGNTSAGIRFGGVTTSNGVTEWARILDNGNVGIGTASPSQKLDVAGNANVSGNGYVGGTLGLGTTSPTQQLDVRGNVRLGADGGNVAGTGQAIEFVGPGFNTDPVGFYRLNTAADQSELRVVVGDVPDANDKFVVGRMPGTNAEGGIPAGSFTPTFSVSSTGQVNAPGLAGTGTRVVTADAAGTLATQALPTDAQQLSLSGQTLSLTNGGSVTLPSSSGTGDNLGNHTATQALNLQGNPLVGTGADLGTAVGVGIRADGGLNMGQNTYNIFLGYQSGYSNSYGGGNTFLGYQSGYKSVSSNWNLFSGQQSGYSTTTGNSNTFIGNNSGYQNTTGSDNVAVGYLSGQDSGAGALNNTIALGSQARVNTSNTIQLGNLSISSLRCKVGLTVVSDARFKYDVQANVPGLAFINGLRPVTYRFDQARLAAFERTGALAARSAPDAEAEVHTGFLAQEVEAAAQALGFRFDGVHAPANARDHYGLGYAQFVVPLVRAVQELSAENAALKARAAAAEAQAAQATATLESFEARLRRLEAGAGQAQR
jgi:hypothetical protein